MNEEDGKKLAARSAERQKALENPEFLYVNIDHVYHRRDDPRTGEMLEGGFVLAWGAKGIGFGQLAFHQNGDDIRKLKITCSSEHMGKDFVRQALEYLAKTVEISD